jgi:hypothetical protein
MPICDYHQQIGGNLTFHWHIEFPGLDTKKFQTAAQIFNESDDYAAGAEYMLLVEECMGEVNDRKASDLKPFPRNL